jgi:hypothetical protein
MSEQLNATASFDENGKPYNVEPGSALLGFEGPGECLMEQANPGVDIPARACETCGASGGVQGGIYYSADTARSCGRYQTSSQPTPVELTPRTIVERELQTDDREYLRALARAAGLLQTVEPVPRERFPGEIEQAA